MNMICQSTNTKKIEYVPVEYAPTSSIMAELHELEMEITQGLSDLEDLL